MWLYLLKSSACLFGFWAFYRLLLENSSMHHFKRFYLLGSLVASLVIPILTVTYTVSIPASGSALETVRTASLSALPGQSPQGSPWMGYLNGLYFTVAFLLLLKFVTNLFHLFRKIRAYPALAFPGGQLILHDRDEVPHSFMRFIFLNRNAYQSGAIPPSVLAHEKAHVRQRHSLDILLLEVLQVFLWVNPIFLLIKRASRLNHEFLADREVLYRGYSLHRYQQSLLSYSSSSYKPAWAHAINYSSIKKRLIIMKKHTPTPSKYLRFTLVLPLFLSLFYGFSNKVPVYISGEEAPRLTAQDTASQALVAEYNSLAAKYNAMSKDNFRVLGKEVDRMRYIYDLMSPAQKAAAEPFPTLPEPPAPPQPLSMEDSDLFEEEEEISIDANVESEIENDIRTEVETNIETSVESEIESDIRTEVETEIEIEEAMESGEDVLIYEPGEAADVGTDRKYKIVKKMRKESKDKMEDKGNRRNMNKNRDDKPRLRKKETRTMVYEREGTASSNKNRDFTYTRNTRGIPAPPVPPAAEGPEIDMKNLARRGAVFYLEGNEVSAEEAMEFIETTQQIKVHVQDNKGQKPVVRLSSGGS